MSASITPQKPIAFEVEIKENPNAETPDRIQKRFEEVESTLQERKSKSMETLLIKLEAAETRKKALDEQKLEKTKEQNEKAKKVAQETREKLEMEANLQADKLKEKLETASQRAEEHINEKKKKLEEHFSEVNQRKLTASQECLSPGSNEILNKLEAAEQRRKAMEDEKLRKMKLADEKAEEVRKRKAENQTSSGSAI